MDCRSRAQARAPICYLLSVICYLSSPMSAIGASAPAGAARQALIGNAWHAPLPHLLQTPFVAHAFALLSLFFQTFFVKELIPIMF